MADKCNINKIPLLSITLDFTQLPDPKAKFQICFHPLHLKSEPLMSILNPPGLGQHR